ncbi:hypothetical protein ACFTXK_14270 [Streptomyces sp. NPDC056956]|uniref:hypothetical protein n=1 Tax=Streptomyces sp. NPDC056956 TaxID=3345980 RepID=UPI00362A5DC2
MLITGHATVWSASDPSGGWTDSSVIADTVMSAVTNLDCPEIVEGADGRVRRHPGERTGANNSKAPPSGKVGGLSSGSSHERPDVLRPSHGRRQRAVGARWMQLLDRVQRSPGWRVMSGMTKTRLTEDQRAGTGRTLADMHGRLTNIHVRLENAYPQVTGAEGRSSREGAGQRRSELRNALFRNPRRQ